GRSQRAPCNSDVGSVADDRRSWACTSLGMRVMCESAESAWSGKSDGGEGAGAVGVRVLFDARALRRVQAAVGSDKHAISSGASGDDGGYGRRGCCLIDLIDAAVGP